MDRYLNRRATDDGQSEEASIAVLVNDVTHIKKTVDSIENCVIKNYVTRLEFDPIKQLVYGTVAIILSAVIIALVTMVVKGALK